MNTLQLGKYLDIFKRRTNFKTASLDKIAYKQISGRLKITGYYNIYQCTSVEHPYLRIDTIKMYSAY